MEDTILELIGLLQLSMRSLFFEQTAQMKDLTSKVLAGLKQRMQNGGTPETWDNITIVAKMTKQAIKMCKVDSIVKEMEKNVTEEIEEMKLLMALNDNYVTSNSGIRNAFRTYCERTLTFWFADKETLRAQLNYYVAEKYDFEKNKEILDALDN